MKSTTEYLTFNVPARMGFVNITSQVEQVVRRERRQGGTRALQCHAHYRLGIHQRR